MIRKNGILAFCLALSAAGIAGSNSGRADDGPAQFQEVGEAAPLLSPAGEAAEAPGPTLTVDSPAEPAPMRIPLAPLAGQPAPATLTAETAEPVADEAEVAFEGTELINERFPNGKVAIRRHVIRDAQGNYVHHGPCKLFNSEGKELGGGDYIHGKPHGRWVRRFYEGGEDSFHGPEYKGFKRPFVSEVDFIDGKPDGLWSLVDAEGRLIHEWHLTASKINGAVVTYYASGRRRTAANFEEGILVGEIAEFGDQEKVVNKVSFLNGHRLNTPVLQVKDGVKVSKGAWLESEQTRSTLVDWWEGEIRTDVVRREAGDMKHGKWVWWHANGKERSKGEYDRDKPIGQHVSWYSNGQKETEGIYIDGAPVGQHVRWHGNGQKAVEGGFDQHGRRDGHWVWWHANGKKQMEGSYLAGHPVSSWMKWNSDGKLYETSNYEAPEFITDPAPHPGMIANGAVAPVPAAPIQTAPVPVPVESEPDVATRLRSIFRR